MGYNWIEEQLQRLLPRKALITLTRHALIAAFEDSIHEEEIFTTVQTGQVFRNKCEPPNKIAFKHYQHRSVIAITRFQKTHIEVKTVWSQKGN